MFMFQGKNSINISLIMRLKWNFNIENTSFFIVLLWIYTLKIKNHVFID